MMKGGGRGNVFLVVDRHKVSQCHRKDRGHDGQMRENKTRAKERGVGKERTNSGEVGRTTAMKQQIGEQHVGSD